MNGKKNHYKNSNDIVLCSLTKENILNFPYQVVSLRRVYPRLIPYLGVPPRMLGIPSQLGSTEAPRFGNHQRYSHCSSC